MKLGEGKSVKGWDIDMHSDTHTYTPQIASLGYRCISGGFLVLV